MKQKEFLENKFLREKKFSLSKFVPALVLSVSLAVTHQLWRNEKDDTEKSSSTNFSLHKKEVHQEIEARMKNYGYTLRWARALFSGGMERRKEFHNFIRDLDIQNKYQGTVGYSFIPLVKKEALADHIHKLKEEGFSDYAVFPSGIRQEYTPVTYTEPFEQNEKIMGYDPFSDPEQRKVMELARDKNSIGITGKVRLVEELNSTSPSGFLMYLPVYRNGFPYSTLEERRANVVGWLAASIKIEEFMKEIMKSGLFDGLDVEMYDGTITEGSLVFHAYDESEGISHPKNAVFSATEKMEMFWRPWTFVFHSLPGFETQMSKGRSTIVGVSWTGISFFLTFLSWLLLHERRMAINFAKNMQGMNRKITENKRKLTAIIGASMDAIIQLNEKGEIVEWSWQAENIFGWRKEEILGKFFIEVILSEQSQKEYTEIIGNLITETKNGRVNHVNELPATRKNGTEFFVEMNITSMDGEGKLELCAFIRDITDRKIAAMKILEMATHDALTGLPNRNLLADRLTQAIRIAERSGENCGVFFIDLDRFKPVNDTFWHGVGDILLEEIAERLETIMRAEDTTARFWGDEFVIVTPGLKSEFDVTLIAEKIIQTLSLPFYIKKHEIFIGASVGIAIFPRGGKNAEDLLKNSDTAMYEAKKDGRGVYREYIVNLPIIEEAG